MAKLIDLTGKQFGRLTVIKRDITKKANEAYWICQCECGTVKSVIGSDLRKGKTKSCGCLQKEIASEKRIKDLKNQKFGKLLVLEKGINNNLKDCHTIWKCKCDCGNIVYVRSNNLISGNTQSCGCGKSHGEAQIKQLLTQLGIKYYSEWSFPDLIDVGPLKFDIYVPDLKILIEYQGIQHFQPITFFGGEQRFLKQNERDNKKRLYCKEHNIKLIEIPYWDYDKLNEDYILNLLNS